MALTALLCALVCTSLLQIVPATAALKEVIIVKSLDVGLPPLIQEREPERMEIAPTLTDETARERRRAVEGHPRD